MSREHLKHAQRVVAAFSEKLSQSGRDHVGAKHFAELEVLIEVAMATAVNETREQLASQLDEMSRTLRASEYSD